MKPTSSGYADGNGIRLLQGRLTTTGEMDAWVQPLAKTWQVIAVEMQAWLSLFALENRDRGFWTMAAAIAYSMELC